MTLGPYVLATLMLGRVRVRLEFKIADAWVGVYFTPVYGLNMPDTWWHVWVCLVPFFPIHFDWHVFKGVP